MEAICADLVKQNEKLSAALEKAIAAVQEKQNPSEITKQKSVAGVHFEKYDESCENWTSFIERFRAFMDVQNIPIENRGKALIASLSPKLYSLLKSLLSPVAPDSKSFDEINDTLLKHLSPKPLIIPSRHAFLNRKQHEGESLSTFLAALRTLAVDCCYPETMLNTMLRDVFVSGLRNKSMLDRLFEEDDTSLERTVQIATALERATIGTNEIFQGHKGLPVNLVKKYKKQDKKQHWSNPKIETDTKSKSSFNKKGKKECFRCGDARHTGHFCKHKDSICSFCSKRGHLHKCCFKAKRLAEQNGNTNPKIFSVKSNEEETFPIYNLSGKRNHKSPILVDILIDEHPTTMELDTGSAVSVMSYENFRRFSNKVVKPTGVFFKTYKGDVIKPKGSVKVNICYKGRKNELELFIVEENLDTIMGRDWLFAFKLDWSSIKAVKICNSNPPKTQLQALLNEYADIFEDKMGEINSYECKLQLKENVVPVFRKARTVPLALKDRVEQELVKLEELGIIEKVDYSEWATPVVPIVKKDGSIRLCADYSATVNPNIQVHQHPLPITDDIFSALSGGKTFSKIDFSKAYLQMKVDSATQKLLTINTHKGLFKCKRLMFGLNAAPAIWQRFVEMTFQDMEGVRIFMDDARLTGPTDEIHLARLRSFFQKCREVGIQLSLSKSEFFQKEIDFLGFKISEQGLMKTNEKVKAILDVPTPKNVQEVKSFLGLVNFYGRFCPNLSTTAYHLNNLTKKDVKWSWSRKCQRSFESIKKEICSNKVLTHYDPKLPLILSTDASPVGIGAVLSHRFKDGNERPIAFASKTLNKAEMKYSQIDKEALSISWAVKKFYLYLQGRRFTLLTDHKPLVSIFGCKKGLPVLSATRLLHYALQLQAFQFDIQYRNTKEHGNADCLSRFPLKSEDLEIIDDVSMYQLTQIETLPVTAKDLAKATQQDDELGPLYQSLLYGGKLEGKEAVYSLEGGCVMYSQRVCIPKCYQSQVLEELHAGHVGIVKMKAIARSHVYWKNIDKDIENMANGCRDCAKFKTNPAKAKVHYWEYPSTPWERIHIDFAGPFYEHYFLLVVDAHSKWLEVFPIKNIKSSTTIDCLRNCFARFGLPVTLVSDNGSQLTSHEFEHFLRANGIKHKTCAPFHPQSNGQAERYVFTLKQALRAMDNFPGNIHQKLTTFLMQYRKSPNATTQQSPAMMFLKRDIRTRIDLLKPNIKQEVENKLRRNVDSFYDRTFEIGDRVAIRDYTATNSKWTFGSVINKDGPLHYTVLLNGNLYRRHVDQMRGTDVQAIPEVVTRFVTPSSGLSSEVASEAHEVKESHATPVPPDSTVPERTPEIHPIPDSETVVSNQPNRTEKQGKNFTPRRSKRTRKPPDRLDL